MLFTSLPIFCKSFKAGLLISLFGLLAAQAGAQLIGITPDTATPLPGTGKEYEQMGVDTVNPADGSLSLRINLPMPKGRGVTLPFSILYDSNSAFYPMPQSVKLFSTVDATENGTLPFDNWVTEYIYQYLTWTSQSHDFAGFGWAYGVPMLSTMPLNEYVQFLNSSSNGNIIITEACPYITGYVFQDANGGRHDLHMTYYNPSTTVTSVDGSQITDATKCQTDSHPNNPQGGDLYVESEISPYDLNDTLVSEADGTTYHFPYLNFGTRGVAQGKIGLPDFLIDRNGNKISIMSGQNGSFTYTDTLGRPVLSADGFAISGTGTNNLTVSGVNSPYKIAWEALGSTSFQTNSQTTSLGGNDVSLPYCKGFSNTVATPGMTNGVQTITLPDQSEYQFEYNNQFGLISKITYPNGGWAQYTWNMIPLRDHIDYSYYDPTNHMLDTTLPVIFMQPGCWAIFDKIAVTARDVSFDGVNVAFHQDFSYPQPTFSGVTPDWTQMTTTVTSTDNIAGTSYSTQYTYVPSSGHPDTAVPIETSIVTTQNASTLRAESKSWYIDSVNNEPRIACDQVVDNGILTSLKAYAYTPIGSQLAQVSEYASGNCPAGGVAGPNLQIAGQTLLRVTSTAYASFPQKPYFPYSLPSIVDRPSSTVISDGSRQVVAETDYAYDQFALTPASGASQHDDDCYGVTTDSNCEKSFAGALAPTFSIVPRGNLTMVTRKCIGSSCNGNPSTTYTYDTTGQVASMTDPKQNVTRFSYGNSYSDTTTAPSTNAYLTFKTNPQANGVTTHEYFQYRYADGQLSSSQDDNDKANNRYMNYDYDAIGRLQDIRFPDTGETAYSYTVASLASSITTKQLLAGSTWNTTVANLDGMGHVTSTQNLDVYKATDYDGSGRPYKIYNPTRCSPPRTKCDESTWGYTQYTYDALGRKTAQVDADEVGTQKWAYNGNMVTYKDENGNQWERTFNTLGNLAQVWEPNGASQTPTLETDYTYDTLNNLILLKQWGGQKGASGVRQRSFTYNSLSQLVTATNPESEMLNYTYDANGNVATKTDARGVTTSYGYDPLNRITSKTYINDPNHTPTSCYQYDSSAVNYGIGRLANAWTQSGSSCSTPISFWTMRSILAYDFMGRLVNEKQCTPSNCSSDPSSFYAPTYAYDLAGNLVSHTNGTTLTPSVGTLLFTNSYDAMGRLQTVGSNWVDPTHPTPLLSAQSGTNQCSDSTAAYSASGGLMNAQFGSGLTLNRAYDSRLRTACENDMGSTVQNTTLGSATITITGAELSR